MMEDRMIPVRRKVRALPIRIFEFEIPVENVYSSTELIDKKVEAYPLLDQLQIVSRKGRYMPDMSYARCLLPGNAGITPA